MFRKQTFHQENYGNQKLVFSLKQALYPEKIKKRKLCHFLEPFVNKMYEDLPLIILGPLQL